MQMSKLHIHSYGIVAVNKARSSLEIEVNPIEETSLLDGEITDHASEEKVKGKDADGASFEAATTTSATLTARWLPFGSNRVTPPDVRRGEKVAIYRFGDADKYYWTSLEYNADLRKLETVVFAISNTQVESDKAGSENTYFIEFSTHDKRIHLHTSQSDGEPFGYDMVLNTKEGTFQLKDTIDNAFVLDSEAHRWIIVNTEGSYVEVVKEDVNIYAVKNFNVLAGQDITLQAGNDKLVVVGGAEKTQVGGSRSAVVGGSIDYTAPSGINFVTPMLRTSGELTTGSNAYIGGGVSTGTAAGGNGSSSIKGSMSITGAINSSSSASFAGSVSASNIS